MKKRYLYISYALFWVFMLIFVNKSLKVDNIKISNENSDEDAFEVKPVRAIVNIDEDNYKQQYVYRINNNETVADLFESLRKERGFSFEKTAYIYGTELTSINGITPPDGFRWAVFNLGNDITYEIGSANIGSESTDSKTYNLRIIQK